MPQGPSLTLLAALVASQAATREYLGQMTVGLAQQAAADYTAWYSADAVATWTAELVTMSETVLSTLSGFVAAYTATALSEMTGRWFRPGALINLADLRSGVTHAQAFERAAAAYRYQQSRLDQAAIDLATADTPKVPKLQLPVDAAVKRAAAVADRSTQLVVAQQSALTLAEHADAAGIIGWRRMVHPELSRTGTCGLCIAASTRLYKTGDLMAIHDHCHCLPMPVLAGSDPGLELDRRGFAALYGEAGGTTRELLKKTRYQTVENGELGPMLAPAGAKQRGPRQVKADTTDPRPVRRAVRDHRLADLRDSLTRSMPRLDALAEADPVRWASYRQTVADRIRQLPAA